MNQKSGDLLLSVIDFFGILIPGAVLAFLHGDFILPSDTAALSA